jgi:mono/diheme cytochrome c family protein
MNEHFVKKERDTMRSLRIRPVIFSLSLLLCFLLMKQDRLSNLTVTAWPRVAASARLVRGAFQGTEGWKLPANAKETKNPVKATPASIAKGKDLYKTYCQMCHGEKGDGQGPMAANLQQKPGNLTDKNLLGKVTDGELFWMISKGKLPMPAFEKTMAKENIWHIVNYIRTLAK